MAKQNQKKITCSSIGLKDGLSIDLLDYGATIKSLRVPTKQGVLDAILGYPHAADYLHDPHYMGSTLGRYAGRIANGKFKLNDGIVKLNRNDTSRKNCLHGGEEGFARQFWTLCDHDESSASYEYFSPAGDQGFPGNVTARVNYSLISPMVLQIEYYAESDKDTVINLSNHAYFNLNSDKGSIDNHHIWISSNKFLPMNENFLPSGEVRHVNDTAFDFRCTQLIADQLQMDSRQLDVVAGFDHFFLLYNTNGMFSAAASITSPESGLRLKMFTTQPGVQFYTGNNLSGAFQPRQGLCMEFQKAPDSPNNPGFPSTLLKAGEIYRQHNRLEFEQI